MKPLPLPTESDLDSQVPFLKCNEDIMQCIDRLGYWKLGWMVPDLKAKYKMKTKKKLLKGAYLYFERMRMKNTMDDGIEMKVRKIFAGNSPRIIIVEIPDMFVQEFDIQPGDSMLIWHQDKTLMMQRKERPLEASQKKEEKKA